MAPDHDAAAVVVAIVVIPPTMPATIVPVEFDPRAAIIAVVIIAVVATHIDAEALGARERRNADGHSCGRGKHESEFLHVPFSIVVDVEPTNADGIGCR